MDFEKLIHEAHKNNKTSNKDVKWYKTKYEPPKKEVKNKSNLSANIQKFLQKRDEEDRKKAEEEQRKKKEHLALQSQDIKSYKRVQTKSANKSVMKDAIDNVNTAVTMAGPQQCDEDDYGFVSQEASAYYAKFMEKYSNILPEEPKFPQGKKSTAKGLNTAKDRVRATLQKEEEMLPHKRKRKTKCDNMDGESENKQNGRRSKPIKVLPPILVYSPVNCSDLLTFANIKQYEPILMERKDTEDECTRPMTKKQRMEYQLEPVILKRRMQQENTRNDGHVNIDAIKKTIPKMSKSENSNKTISNIGRINKKCNGVERTNKVNERRPNNQQKTDTLRHEQAGKSYKNSIKGAREDYLELMNDIAEKKRKRKRQLELMELKEIIAPLKDWVKYAVIDTIR